MILYFTGGLTGEAAGYAWQPYGTGNSIAVFGLVGGLLLLILWKRNIRVPPIASLFIVYWVATLTGYAIGSIVVAVGLCVLAGAPLVLLLQRAERIRPVALYMGIVGLLGAIALTALHDIHGPAIAAGSCAAFLMLKWGFGARFSAPL